MRKAIVTQLICLWGIISFLALCTECATLTADLLVKGSALASLLACLYVGKKFDQAAREEKANEERQN